MKLQYYITSGNMKLASMGPRILIPLLKANFLKIFIYSRPTLEVHDCFMQNKKDVPWTISQKHDFVHLGMGALMALHAKTLRWHCSYIPCGLGGECPLQQEGPNLAGQRPSRAHRAHVITFLCLHIWEIILSTSWRQSSSLQRWPRIEGGQPRIENWSWCTLRASRAPRKTPPIPVRTSYGTKCYRKVVPKVTSGDTDHSLP